MRPKIVSDMSNGGLHSRSVNLYRFRATDHRPVEGNRAFRPTAAHVPASYRPPFALAAIEDVLTDVYEPPKLLKLRRGFIGYRDRARGKDAFVLGYKADNPGQCVDGVRLNLN
jgi:hypothetical protein